MDILIMAFVIIFLISSLLLSGVLSIDNKEDYCGWKRNNRSNSNSTAKKPAAKKTTKKKGQYTTRDEYIHELAAKCSEEDILFPIEKEIIFKRNKENDKMDSKENDKTNITDASFDDERYKYAFAYNYNLDPDKDLDLLKKIHSITTVRRVYDAKQNSSESVVEYFNEIKDFVTSEQYHKIDNTGKRRFEHRVFEILKDIVIKGIGTDYFVNVPTIIFETKC